MEEQLYYSLVTDVGRDAITKAVQKGEKVNIVSFAVGDGNGAYYRPDRGMTELRNEVWRGAIKSYEIDEFSPNVIIIRALLPSDVGGWTIREMAVFDEKERMIGVCNLGEIEKIISSNGMISEIELTLKLAISNQDSLNFIIDPNAIIATLRDLERHNTSKNAHGDLFFQALYGDIDCGYFKENPIRTMTGTFKVGEYKVGQSTREGKA